MRRTAVFLVVPVLVSALLSWLPAAGPPAGAAPDGSDEPRFQALVFSKTNGFRHESIPAGNAAIEQLSAEHDFAVTVTEDASVFTDEQSGEPAA